MLHDLRCQGCGERFQASAAYVTRCDGCSILGQACAPREPSAPAPAETAKGERCPTCGFRVRTVERQPFVLDDET